MPSPNPLNVLSASPVTSVNLATDLRPVNINLLKRFAIAFTGINPANAFFYYDLSSLLADNGTSVIKPDAVGGASPGRWIKFSDNSIPPYRFNASGVYSSIPLPLLLDGPQRVDTNRVISKVTVTRRYSGTSGNTRVQILKNNIPVFSSALSIPSGADYASVSSSSFASLGINALVVGDMIDVQLTGAESYKASPEGPSGLGIDIFF